MGFSRALSRGDIQTARQAIEKLKWLGRDGPSRHTELGRRLARQGEDAAALIEFRRSVELNPTVRAWKSIALLFEQRREWQSAASAYDSVLALQPDDASMLFRVGRAWLEAGRPENAIEPLERAAVLAPGQKLIGLNLARARRESEAHSQP
jgi:tetratricopeptide (TPR) repeat protein